MALQNIMNDIFESIRPVYTKAKDDYKKVITSDLYTDVYAKRERDKILKNFREQKQSLYEKALGEVKKERNSIEKTIADASNKNLSVEERLLLEMQRNNKILLAQNKVKNADVTKLKEILEQSNGDKDISELILSEIEGRKDDSIDANSLMEIRFLAKEVSPFIEVDNLEKQLMVDMEDTNEVKLSLMVKRSIEQDFDILEEQNSK